MRHVLLQSIASPIQSIHESASHINSVARWMLTPKATTHADDVGSVEALSHVREH